MRYVEIPRTGDVPLSFRGEPVAFQSSRGLRKGEATRWHEITAYRTDDGRYVVHVGCRSTWRGEPAGDVAVVLGRLEDAGEIVQAAVPPVQALAGYPTGARLDRKRAALEADVMLRLHDALSALLGSLSAEEGLPGKGARLRVDPGQPAHASGF